VREVPVEETELQIVILERESYRSLLNLQGKRAIRGFTNGRCNDVGIISEIVKKVCTDNARIRIGAMGIDALGKKKKIAENLQQDCENSEDMARKHTSIPNEQWFP
jgi:hypothetical protein